MLLIFVRHTRKCLGDPARQIPGLLDKGLSAEALRLYKHCDCPKWYSGTHNGLPHPRQTLNANSWAEAERHLEEIKNGKQEDNGVSVARAVKEWLDEVRVNRVAQSTLEQWTCIGQKLIDYAAARKIKSVTQINPKFINEWRAAWTQENPHNRATPGILRSTTKTRLTVVKMFFRFVRRQRWIKENPMELIYVSKAKRGETQADHKTLPVDVKGGDRNYRNLLDAIDQRRNGAAHLNAITQLMYETGLRVSDAMMFDLSTVEVDEDGWGVYTATQIKTGLPVTVGIPPQLMEVLTALPARSPRHLFLPAGVKFRPYYRNNVYGPLKLAGDAAGVHDMHPHRLRDSFAVNRLNEGMTMDQVSLLLGHASVLMTEMYYAPFVQSRKDTLLARRKAIHGVVPNPRVVSIKKRA